MSTPNIQSDPNDHELTAYFAEQAEKGKPQKQLNLQKTFIKRFVNARIDKGQPQVVLAQKAGVPQSAVARVESGTSNPTLKTLVKLADAMGYELTLVRKHD